MTIGDVDRVTVDPFGAINGSTTTGFNSLDHFTFPGAVDIVTIHQRGDICFSIT